MTSERKCAALAVLHEAIDTEFRQGEIYDAVESIKFNGPFITVSEARKLIEQAYREGHKAGQSGEDWGSDWEYSTAKSALD